MMSIRRGTPRSGKLVLPAGPSDLVPFLDNNTADFTPLADLLTIPDVAKLLRISVVSVRRLQAARRIPFFKIGGSVRFARGDLVAYLDGCRVGCRMLITHADGMLRDLILTALRTGMRQGELRGLQWSSVDWETRRLIVRHSRCDYRNILDTPKSNRERSIPLDNDLYVLLLKRRKSDGYVFTDAQGRPFNHHRLCTLLARVCEKSGLRRISWHVLRHTFASHLAMKGVPLNIVQTLLGHTSITTTLRYAHVAPSTLRTAIDLLNPAGQYPDLGQPVGNQWLDLQRKAAAGGGPENPATDAAAAYVGNLARKGMSASSALAASGAFVLAQNGMSRTLTNTIIEAAIDSAFPDSVAPFVDQVVDPMLESIEEQNGLLQDACRS